MCQEVCDEGYLSGLGWASWEASSAAFAAELHAEMLAEDAADDFEGLISAEYTIRVRDYRGRERDFVL